MTSFVKPKIRRLNEPLNALGHARADYEGNMSTLCAGCGHDSVTAARGSGRARPPDRRHRPRLL